MVQKRRRTQFTAKFKEQLEKVESIIQEAIENLPDVEVEGSLAIFISKVCSGFFGIEIIMWEWEGEFVATFVLDNTLIYRS